MRITKSAVTRTCAICERTLLMGERALRFSPDGGDYVDVCPLCQEVALEHGWVKEGAPTTPVLAPERRRRSGRPSLARLLAPRRQPVPAPVASSTDPPPPVGAGAGGGRGGRPVQRERLPPQRRRDREEPRRAAGRASCRSPGRAASSSSRSPGTSPGTSTGSARSRSSRSDSPSAATSPASSSSRSRAGTPVSTPTDGSCRTSRGV